MKKTCVARFADGSWVNLTADKISHDGNMVTVTDGDELVGLFDMGVLTAIYISERKEKGKERQ